MASTIAHQPIILPNNVSTKHWSAAEANLDIVLIQFYRCKLCNNEFSSLSRSLVVAHMIQTHETKWKAALAKVSELKELRPREAVVEKEKTKLTNNTPIQNVIQQKVLNPNWLKFAKIIQKEDTVAQINNHKTKVKAVQESKLTSEKQTQQVSANSSVVNDESTTVERPVVDISAEEEPNDITDASNLAVLQAENGISYVTKFNLPSINIQQAVENGIHVVPVDGKSCSKKNSKKEIVCKECNYVCESWTELWSHSHEHLPTAKKKVTVKCQTCKLNFASEASLQHHLDLYPICSMDLSKPGSVGPIKCNLCNFEANNRQSLKIHIGAIHKKQTSKDVHCFYCNAKFTQYRALRRHRRDGICNSTQRGRPKGTKVKTRPRPTVPKVIACDLCNRTFDSNYRYNDHYATHFEEKNQICSECEKAFKTKKALRQHMVVHKGARFPCDLCDFATFWKDSLKKHKELKHFSDEKPFYNCPVCPYKTKDMNALRAHQRYTHREGKDFICEMCGKSFKLQSALKCHLETHDKDLQYPCDKCDFAANTRFGLYNHKSCHVTKEEMRFKCDQCSWVGRRSSELSRHKRKHSVDKLFYCHHCGLGYKHSHGLSRHIKEKHFGNEYATGEISEQEDSNIYTDDIIVAQVFEV